MCPSYQATKDERNTTRARARVLQEAINGSLVSGGWDDPALADSLDMCLSCKACGSDCPTGIDMATYKSEVLHRKYEGKIRPRAHYLLGQLPRWAKLFGPVAPILNALTSIKPLAKLALWSGGMDSRRAIPKFESTPFRKRASHQLAAGKATQQHLPGTQTSVVLWTDSFSDNMAPPVAHSTLRVLQKAGYDVHLPQQNACCGLTWISTGQLTSAKKRLTHLLDVLHPYVAQGMPIIGVEPSCTAVLRSDLVELLPDDPRARQVSEATKTLAELLTSKAPFAPKADFELPDLSGLTVVAQPHCHQYSVMGFTADQKLLEQTGATVQTLSGCCGLAGNWGMEKGHYEVSVQVAETSMLPAIRAIQGGGVDAAGQVTTSGISGPAVLLADGFSCRTQAADLADQESYHLAQLLDGQYRVADRSN